MAKVKPVTMKQQEGFVLTDACTFSSRSNWKRRYEYSADTF
jgi:hypothetical protein